jgi:hypothetical protein
MELIARENALSLREAIIDAREENSRSDSAPELLEKLFRAEKEKVKLLIFIICL